MKKISLIKGKKFVVCTKKINIDKKDKNAFKPYHKVRNHCHYVITLGNIEELLIIFVI